jgi:hypothetical protein
MKQVLRRLRLALLASTMALLASITTIVMAAPLTPFPSDTPFPVTMGAPAAAVCPCWGAGNGFVPSAWPPT